MRGKPKPTPLLTQGIFNLPHHIGMVWEELAFDYATSYIQWSMDCSTAICYSHDRDSYPCLHGNLPRPITNWTNFPPPSSASILTINQCNWCNQSSYTYLCTLASPEQISAHRYAHPPENVRLLFTIANTQVGYLPIQIRMVQHYAVQNHGHGINMMGCS